MSGLVCPFVGLFWVVGGGLKRADGERRKAGLQAKDRGSKARLGSTLLISRPAVRRLLLKQLVQC